LDNNFFKKINLDYTEVCSAIDYFKQKKDIKSIYLQAEGEVLLYERYWSVVKYCALKNIKLQNLITNGILVDKHIDQILKHYSGITISVDGYDHESYMKRRGGTEKIFQHIIDNTRRLVNISLKIKKRFTIAYNCVLLENNYRIMPKMIELAEKIGIDRMQFRNFHSYDSSNSALRPLYNTKKIQEFINKLKSKPYKVQVKWPEIYGTLRTFNCKMLFDTVTIGSDGYFAPCCHIPSKKNYGSFFKNAEGYNTGELEAFRHKFIGAKTRYELPRQCWECPRLTANGTE
jgi:MoaA/NifB/PqqE/SkfB family radical SAM enzyme